MVNLNKSILRTLLITSYILVVIVVVSGISTVLAYLNTGADRDLMLHTELKRDVQYTPKISWNADNDEGLFLDNETLKTLERDYLDAWYVKHIAFKTNTTFGLDDYYTKQARENLYEFIEKNKAEHITIQATTLNHNPKVTFFSADGKMVVMTDTNVVEYKRVFKDEKLIIETKEKASYQLILLFEDNFWRIHHIVKSEFETYKPDSQQITHNLNIQGINYYPQATPWNMFGDEFNINIINNDFKIIKDAGLNSVRLFVPYNSFGKSQVKPEKLEKLKQVLDAAHKNDLKVVLTLFDFYGDYSVLNWTLNQQHAQTIVSTFKNHDALLAWDIKNEPNLDFENRGESLVVAWLDNMIDVVKAIDEKHPVTIGWSNAESAVILNDKVDFISFHYYEDLENLDETIKTLKQAAPNKQLVLQEFGLSSYRGLWNPFGTSEEDQANYHKKIQEIIALNELQYMSWTLYDFDEIPKEVVGELPWRIYPQKKFGFINKKGEKKASFNYIHQK